MIIVVSDINLQTWQHINPDCSRIGLIKTSLDTKETSFHGYVDIVYSVAIIIMVAKCNFTLNIVVKIGTCSS